ncbi:MAG: propanediol/glycerol family dehydratase medium subunit [Thermoanaerobacterium sp.]|nr:propanediol/glycerol family dehydratase medium subunit [Thermoanaerobacterium sp.]
MYVDENLLKEITKRVIEEINKKQKTDDVPSYFIENGIAHKGKNIKEVVIGIGPAFGKHIKKTINGLDHKDVIKEIIAGIEEEGMVPRIVRVLKTSDVAFIGKEAALLSGSGIGIGLQSKGTTVIHQKDLYPLSNLELFPQAPLLNLELYREIGKNAARYAKGMMVKPILIQNDYMVRPKYQVKAAIMHIKETERILKNAQSVELAIDL